MLRYTIRSLSLFGSLLLLQACAAPMPSPDASAPDATTSDVVSFEASSQETGACVDMDNDGHPSAACGGDDCDDNNPRRNPGVREVCDSMGVDEDCDPCTVSGGGLDGDSDADGFERSTCANPWPTMTAPAGCNIRLTVDAMTRTVRGTDCNDVVAMMGAQQNPGLPEVCANMIDDNCNGSVDEAVTGTLYRDVDNDGRGDRSGAAGTTMMANICAMTPGWVANSDDCDDARNETYRGAREMCDGRDNDCSLPGAMAGGVDSAEDADGDRHSPVSATCLGRGEVGALGSAFPKDDCNDTVATIYTGATEVCGNGMDEDCDTVIDNPTQRVCDDRDGDGHGDPSTVRTVMSCMAPAGTVTVCDDCEDNLATGAVRFPGNREVCDRVDNDCSTPSTREATNEDEDNDGFASTTASCAGRGEAGVAATALPKTDCVDSDRSVNPSAVEFCDRVDSNCSSGGGVAAEEDADMDRFSAPSAMCVGLGEAGAPITAFARTDCDDTRSAVNPGVMEDLAVCDGVDSDCSAATSELARSCPAEGACTEGGVCARASAIAQVVVGATHTCARRNDGTVECWGDNGRGQLGIGTTGGSATRPGAVVMLTDAVEITGGGYHTCARRNNGTVVCWGYNGSGQIGDGTSFLRANIAPVFMLSGVVEIAAGSDHTCARRVDGIVSCWGFNGSGQLGDGTTNQRLTPVVVAMLSNVVEITAGGFHTCARRRDGTVLCWGSNITGQVGDGTILQRLSPTVVSGLSNVVELAAGGFHTCARRSDGTALCWGSNGGGQIGDGTTTLRPAPTVVPSLTNIVGLAAGGTHTCARRSDGTALCWGQNSSGQLGDGTTTQRLTPTVVSGLSNVVELAASNAHTCARRADGTVVCWGNNGNGQLGDGTTTDRPTATATALAPRVVAVTTGSFHGCARFSDGSVRCWGSNTFGQLGDGTTSPRLRPTPIASLTNIVEVTAGAFHTCARRGTGEVLCWGRNDAGQLGDGTATQRLSPTNIPSLTNIAELEAGGFHTCARRSDGAVFCWGRNDLGQVGDGTTTQRSSPTLVASLSNIAEVEAGAFHSCARHNDGTVRCWGANGSGQLGDGTTAQRSTPITVPALAGVVQLVAGGMTFPAGTGHTCARRNDGTVSCWGANGSGQLGDGTTTQRTSPTAVAMLSMVADLTAGDLHTCARRADGVALCWGYNNNGQLGDGTTVSRSAPTVIPTLSNVLEVTAGNVQTCARRVDATVLCWGGDTQGVLGIGVATPSVVPVVLPL